MEFCRAVANTAAAGGTEGHNCFAAKTVTLQKGRDNARRPSPPNGVTNKNRIILIHVGNRAGYLRTGVGIVLLALSPRIVCGITDVGGRIGDRRRNLIEIRVQIGGDILRDGLGIAGGGEIGHQHRAAGGLRIVWVHRSGGGTVLSIPGEVAVQDGGRLGPSGAAVRVEEIAISAVDDPLVPRPGNGAYRIGRDGALVGKGGLTGNRWAAVRPPEDRGELGAGDGVVRAEAPVAVTGDDAPLIGPGRRSRILSGGRHIGEGSASRLRPSRLPPENRGELGA